MSRQRNQSIFREVRKANPKASRSEFGSLLRSAYAGKRNPDGGDRPTESNPRGGNLLMWGALAVGAYFVMSRMNKPAG